MDGSAGNLTNSTPQHPRAGWFDPEDHPRHTFATLHLQQDPGRLLYVSRQLGHSSISITADVYAKWLKATDKAAADSLATDAWQAARA